MTTPPGQPSVANWRSYADLLGENRDYRTFWLAGVVSQFGNWFNYIAIFVLLDHLTGSGQAMGWFLIAKFLPSAVLGPAAGVVADRLPRKAIMIFCDVARVFVVLAFLAIDDARFVPLVYALALAQESLWTFADPARRSSVPNLVAKRHLNLANALSGATWSVLLAFGAALGGLVTAAFGWRTAIVIDALTFAASAAMLARIPLPHRRERSTVSRKTWREISGIADIQAGYSYMRDNREVAALLLVKSGWALSGGILVMLAVFGEQIFPLSRQGGGSGLFYSFRGLGAAVGPILAWRLLGESRPAMYRGIALSFFVSAGAYLLFSRAPSLWFALPMVLLGHIGGSIQWVFSTTLLQDAVPDFIRGRVFAAEMAMVTLMLSLSTWLTGLAMEMGTAPRTVTAVLALLFLVPGLSWAILGRRLLAAATEARREEHPR
ncbi:MAG: MFS transporter [Thermodesulfobacteriota bacterium]